MNPIKFGWIDYSSEHRNKVLAVLDALSEPDAVDEMGIGLIRDGFADILFPGTSTIQTRAKYFLIVPYLLMELEKERFTSPQRFLEKLGQEEIELIDVLNQAGFSGVIGARARKKLKRKPSSIYWNGLRTFGIFRYPTLSLDNYAKAHISMQKNKNAIIASGHDEHDDELAHGEFASTFWRCLVPDANWKETLSINLTKNEAEYLKGRITKAEKSKDSLYAFLLRQDLSEVTAVESFETIGSAFTLPEHLLADYTLAKKFSQFISGANIRYNVILSNYTNPIALDKWKNWLNSAFVRNEFESFPYLTVIERLHIRNTGLRLFLKNWQEEVLSGNDDKMDQLIIDREKDLKSKERAKLLNSKVYSYKEGDWVGTEMLHYRFRNARGLISDIKDGLEGHHA
ncbi:DUF6361 family protein [Neobacillus sp. SAB-20_R2A]|uniref:DUF6361 family protein n=1 Tax=Neobacillus sp. SAB-20_R2A TaxID=3120519 RepID=UPI003C6E1828